MAVDRKAPIAFRLDPEVKLALAFIADREGRSKANMMEWLIRKHCEREGLGWPLPDLVQSADQEAAVVAKSKATKAKPPRAVRKTKQA